MTVTKMELANILFDELGLNKREAKEFVELFFEEIRSALENGDNVKFSGFGSFSVRDKPQRPGRNPKTGEEIPVSARRVVTYKASQKIKDRVAGSLIRRCLRTPPPDKRRHDHARSFCDRASENSGKAVFHDRGSERALCRQAARPSILGAGISTASTSQEAGQSTLLPETRSGVDSGDSKITVSRRVHHQWRPKSIAKTISQRGNRPRAGADSGKTTADNR